MNFTLTKEVELIGSINFEGNIIPMEWFSNIVCDSGKPDVISIIILSDIIYWYRPTIIRNESTGKIIGSRKKFKADLLQRSYSDLENQFGFSRSQIKDSLRRLEKNGLILRIFRNISNQGSVIANVMFLKPFPEKIKEITKPEACMKNFPQTCTENPSDVHGNLAIPQDKFLQTYTETTTKTSTKNTLSKKSKPDSIEYTEKYEREREMINIWDKLIKERDRPSVCNQARLVSLEKVIEDYFEGNLDNWKSYCLNIKNSSFLMGGGNNNWKADLTWAIKQENLIRVIEGYYHKKEEKEYKANFEEEILEEKEIVSNDPVWNKVKELLKVKRGEAIYSSWFRKLSFERYEKDKVLLIAPTKFIKEWVLSHFKEDIIDSFKETEIIIKDLEIFIKNEEVISI